VEIAKAHDIIIHSDEVYRPLFHSITPMDPEFPPSLMSLSYPKTIVTGSLSKAYALAGIRVGWIASRSSDLIDACTSSRDYTTISVSQIDDQIASYALSENCIHGLLSRNIKLAKTNLQILEQFIESHSRYCEWVKPRAGTTAFIRFSRDGKPIDDVKFCEILQEKTGVMFCPGNECFAEENDFKGYVRMGFVCETQVLKDGLEALSTFMQQHLAEIPLAL
jgi:aspartate/methionine/tyrosine aminotransferase